MNFSEHLQEAASGGGRQCGALRYFMQPAVRKGSAVPYGDQPEAGWYVRAGDAQLYYEVYGEGDPLLVLHGGGVGSSYEMGRLIDKLRRDHQVIVFSTRGHGRSEIGRETLSFAQRAEDVHTVIAAAAGKAVKILGFSDGAYTAYALAAAYPEDVNRIAAIGAGTVAPGFFRTDMTWEDLRRLDQAFIAQQERLAPEPEGLPRFFHEYMTFWSRAEVGEDLLRRIAAPVLLIGGDEDDHAPVITVTAAAQMIPKSRLFIVPQAGHAAFLDQEALGWSAVQPFIEETQDQLTPSVKIPYNRSV